MKIWFRGGLAVALLLLVGFSATTLRGSETGADTDSARAKLLSYMLRQQLSGHHYSQKPIDDTLSRAIFALYLKQLDPQKRFLLREDVERLRAWETRIDDELVSGQLELPLSGRQLLQKRLLQVTPMVRDLLASPFDFTRDESIETDAAKLDFASTPAELRERWRLALKFQALNRYLDLLEKESAPPSKARQAELESQARDKVRANFDTFQTRLAAETLQDHYNYFFGAVTRAFDPHTSYLPPTQKEDFDIHMRGSLEGIGATLREEDGYIKVVSIIPGGAAARQGQLQVEDVILEVAQQGQDPVDVSNMRLRDAVSLIRGPKGTSVRLGIRKPDGRHLNIAIVRDVVQIEETFVKQARVLDPASGARIGYVRIPTFYRDFAGTRQGQGGRNSTDDTRDAVKALKAEGIDGLIIDLRSNGGGALTDAVSIAGLFIPSGPVVQVRNSDGELRTLSDDDPSVAYSGPLVVLVNAFSASASEILAGALQDYGRGVIVGAEHTHGKGTVQAVVELDRQVPFRNMDKYRPLGALMLTIQKFYRVSGDSTQYRGVLADITLPDRQQHLETGEKYLDHSLPWDTVATTPFKRWQAPLPDLETLRTRSRERIARDPEFAKISDQAALLKQRSEQTLVSLQLEAARKEREEGRKRLEFAMGGHDEEDLAEKDWQAQLANDPVAREAQAILADILKLGAAETVGAKR